MLGFLDDAAKSVNRFYNSNFADKARQEAIDMLLGHNTQEPPVFMKNPVYEKLQKALAQRVSEYSSTSPISIHVGTWNVNGQTPSPSESLEPWVQPRLEGCPELYVFGIQELIKLTPGTYITSEPDKLKAIWESEILRLLNDARVSRKKYAVLRSASLVSLCLLVFVRQDCIPFIKSVELASKKTGLGGMAANKGGIGLSLAYHDTTIALVTSHFAAGSSAIEERNRDFWTIANGLSFRGKKLGDHDMVIWFGDFNYRIVIYN